MFAKNLPIYACLAALFGAVDGAFVDRAAVAAERVIPHGQIREPGPPLSPADAMSRMVVPDGFHVELVASEPDLVNPVAMTFDDQGRIWVAESVEYPRWEPGDGRDRIKILEDTDGDGRADRFTIFADGLNIPSGLAIGYGGVWVANSPDLLFLKDTDGDNRADTREAVVTGFGRRDTHELPNSLTWGPDGWLYGLNGVFNPSRIRQGEDEFRFTCAVWRIHPRTRQFEVFAEGTSNPWGIAFDPQGSMFLSACVIDHLWHIVEGGYYHRQAGAYPPYTWKIGSIVSHSHQKAAYCGLHYFDSDAYPPEYRDRLYMGNIHGGCINVDELSRRGAGYFARPAADFLSANDAWFMPVAQKTGPDGCLYILDWYDRYHCYQDARRDAAGIDRQKGRLYRIRYRDTPRAAPFDLARANDAELIHRLHHPNVYFRSAAQRLLSERAGEATRSRLEKLVLDESAGNKPRMHALWALIGAGPLENGFHELLLAHPDASLRAWGVRAAGNQHDVPYTIRDRLLPLAGDSSPDVQLQVAVAAGKIGGIDPVSTLFTVLSHAGDDPLIPHIVWQNLLPWFDANGDRVVQLLADERFSRSPQLHNLLPRVVDRLLGGEHVDIGSVRRLLQLLIDGTPACLRPAQGVIRAVSGKLQNKEVTGAGRDQLRAELEPIAMPILQAGPKAPLYSDVVFLATSWEDPRAGERAREILISGSWPDNVRLEALESLASIGDDQIVDLVQPWLAEAENHHALRRGALSALSQLSSPRVADMVLAHISALPADHQALAVELLTVRAAWSKQLLAKIANGELPASILNANHVRKMLAGDDAELQELVQRHWGTIRTERDPQRDQVVKQVRETLASTSGDSARGRLVFNKICGQCHRFLGHGETVGPDLTNNARNSLDQLLSDVFDPNLVVGRAYRAHTIVTQDGRLLNGILVEDNARRIALKMQGGRVESVARGDVLESQSSRLSMMPEGIEKQLSPQDIADLFQFLLQAQPTASEDTSE